jgi:hypothetical protein
MASQTKPTNYSPRAYKASRGRLLLVAAVCVLALAAAASRWSFEGRASSSEPRLVIVASSCLVNVCPSSKAGGRINLRAEGYKPSCSARYRWEVDGGSIVGEGPEVVWDLTDTRPGVGGKFYDARLTVECGGRRVVSQPKRVLAWDCPPQTTTPAPAAVCPGISLHCPAAVRADESALFSATVGGTPGVPASLNWTLSAGEVVSGQGTDSILVDPRSAAGGALRVTLNVKGYGRRCSAACTTEVEAAPTPTPTPTPIPKSDGQKSDEGLTLKVSVVNAHNHSPVPGARVSLYHGPTLLADSVEADAGGIFTRDSLKPGTYRVLVSAERFARREMAVDLNRASGAPVVFSLTPHAPPPGPEPSPSPEPSPEPSPSPSPGASPSPAPSPTAEQTPLPAVPSPGPTNARDGLTIFAGSEKTWLPIALAALAALGVAAYLLQKAFASAPSAIPAAEASAAPTAELAGATTKQSDKVFCTVFGPRSARPKDEFMVQVFAHLKEQASQLEDLAKGLDPSAERFGEKPFGKEVERGRDLFFEFEMSGLEAKEPVQTLTWYGDPASVEFEVAVPPDAEPRKLIGKVHYGIVSDEGAHVPLGHVKFAFEIVAAAAAPAAAQATADAKPTQENISYKKAFISYCSKDRTTVFRELQGLEVGFDLQGIPYFIDQDGIRTSEEWFKVIKANLDESDLFVLFWSSAARDSKEVLKEIEYALERRGGREDGPPYFRPIPIELPLPMPLPKGLEPLHFANKLLLMRKGQEAVDAEVAARTASQAEQTKSDLS